MAQSAEKMHTARCSMHYRGRADMESAPTQREEQAPPLQRVQVDMVSARYNTYRLFPEFHCNTKCIFFVCLPRNIEKIIFFQGYRESCSPSPSWAQGYADSGRHESPAASGWRNRQQIQRGGNRSERCKGPYSAAEYTRAPR